jgi:hypothetical protein
MEFTNIEREILERALNQITDCDDWYNEEYDYETEIKPAFITLQEKLGIKF